MQTAKSFHALSPLELARLRTALNRNVDGLALYMDRETSFIPGPAEVTDEEVISIIKEVPTHYGR